MGDWRGGVLTSAHTVTRVMIASNMVGFFTQDNHCDMQESALIAESHTWKLLPGDDR